MAEARRCAENDSKGGKCSGGAVLPTLLAPSAGASSGGENELDGEKLESSRFVVDSRSEPRIAGAEADLDGLESESFVGVELEPPGVAGVVTVTAPSAASFDGVDVGLRCRSLVVRRSCGWVGRRANAVLIAVFLRRVQILKQRSSVGIVSTPSCMSHSLVA